MYYGVCNWTRSVTEPTLWILFGKENSFNKIILKTKQSEHENVFQGKNALRFQNHISD